MRSLPAMPTLGVQLRRRMLLSYSAVLVATYSLVLIDWGGPHDLRGEALAALVCVVGLLVSLPPRLRGVRYALALACACGAPVAALLFHELIVAQVWSLMPLIFIAMFVRSWHRPTIARIVVALVAAAAVAGLLVAPADVPGLWLILFPGCIAGTAEVFGWLHGTLIQAALRDPLTAVWNRAGLEREADEVIARAARRGHPVAVIVLDIDEFKKINDSAGHQEGDRVLVRVAQFWASRLPAPGVIGRIGGDEFVVVVPDCDEHRAQQLADELGAGGPVAVSTGVAVGRLHDSGAFADLLSQADRDLYRRKRARKQASATAERE